jgi:RimJ/RimL family protein N-acetyltransferase
MAVARVAEAVPGSSIKIGAYAPSLLMMTWDWLNEYPDNNFDDFGPKDMNAFELEIKKRLASGEKLWHVWIDRKPVGIIGYVMLNRYCGSFHGICFAEKWHGRGVARVSVGRIVDDLFESGQQQKISASFFSDNVRVAGLFDRLGFHYEALLFKQTLRGGKSVDMTMMSLFKEDWLCRSAEC